jgi:transketolase
MNLWNSKEFDAKTLRKKILEMAFAGSSVHIGCAFSIVELMAVLYRSHLRYPDNNPNAEERDYLVLSKGHGVMAQYACMHELGWISDLDIEQYFSDGSELKGLSDSRIPGLEVSSGSLGHGFSVGVGMALGAKRLKTDRNVYALVGDGELNEGAIWEGALFAARHELDNLLLIVDQNGFQAMGATKEILNPGNIMEKLCGFGLSTREVDGHDEEEIDSAIRALWSEDIRCPKAIVANTVKGRGVSFMENQNEWHYTRLNENTFSDALHALQLGDGEK